MGFIMLCVFIGALVAILALMWNKVGKPFARRKVCQLLSSLAPKFLAGSKCDLEDVNWVIGAETTISIKGFTIHNLEPFESDHLTKLHRVRITLDIVGAFKSAVKNRGIPKEIEVIRMSVDGCSLILEKSLLSSNVEALFQKLPRKSKADGSKARVGPRVLLRQVQIDGVTVQAVTTLQQGCGFKRGACLRAPSICIDNCSEANARDIASLAATLLSHVWMSSLAALGEAGAAVALFDPEVLLRTAGVVFEGAGALGAGAGELAKTTTKMGMAALDTVGGAASAAASAVAQDVGAAATTIVDGAGATLGAAATGVGAAVRGAGGAAASAAGAVGEAAVAAGGKVGELASGAATGDVAQKAADSASAAAKTAAAGTGAAFSLMRAGVEAVGTSARQRREATAADKTTTDAGASRRRGATVESLACDNKQEAKGRYGCTFGLNPFCGGRA